MRYKVDYTRKYSFKEAISIEGAKWSIVEKGIDINSHENITEIVVHFDSELRLFCGLNNISNLSLADLVYSDYYMAEELSNLLISICGKILFKEDSDIQGVFRGRATKKQVQDFCGEGN